MADGGRPKPYEARSEVDSLEDLAKRLLVDARKHVRSLGAFEVMSERWVVMADSLKRLGGISEMERKLPKAEGATLWECEEVVLRYLLEDGKVNLCLRLVEAFLPYMDEVDAGTKVPKPEEVESALKFEEGIGFLLANVWLHEEALQTTDLPLLVAVLKTILKRWVAPGKYTGPQDKRLLGFAFRTLFAIGKCLDRVGESRVVTEVLKQGLFNDIVAAFAALHGNVSDEVLVNALTGLSTIVASEDFQTQRDAFLAAPETVATLLTLPDLVLARYADDTSRRRALRPLNDLCAYARRKSK